MRRTFFVMALVVTTHGTSLAQTANVEAVRASLISRVTVFKLGAEECGAPDYSRLVIAEGQMNGVLTDTNSAAITRTITQATKATQDDFARIGRMAWCDRFLTMLRAAEIPTRK